MTQSLQARHRAAVGLARLSCGAFAVAVLAACAATATPELDSRFGQANRVLQAQQLVDPQAPQRNGSRVAATDGRTVREATDRQLESFKAPPATTVINIGVGAGGNGR